MAQRSYLLDFLKGIAIIAVVLFHVGILKFGYLGVEIFLVIAGYLTTKSLVKAYDGGNFSYWRFLLNRFVRLWPLLIIVSVVSLVLGYFFMLPDNLKNTAETAVGSSLFLNNFIQYITAGDYWDVSNDFKPLMHTWYVGIIMQFYFIFPLVTMLVHRFLRSWKNALFYVLLLVALCSMGFYVLPMIPIPVHFYMLPSRFFEFCLGGMVALYPNAKMDKNKVKKSMIIAIGLLVLVLLSGFNIDHTKLVVIFTACVTSSALFLLSREEQIFNNKACMTIAKLGVASYSIYLWHQVLFAFYRYTINSSLSLIEYICLVLGALLIGYLSYLWIETGINKVLRAKKKTLYMLLLLCVVVLLPLSYASLKIYLHKGVVRDIPELDVYVNEPATWEPQGYNEAVYGCNKDFPMNKKKNLLVIGDSYGRDWYNVLKEAGMERYANLSYRDTGDSILSRRIDKADIVFLATHGDYVKFKDYLPKMMLKRFFRVGDKKFYSTPGVIYNTLNKNQAYYQQEVTAPDNIIEFNKKEQYIFGASFINPMNLVKGAHGGYLIFTPEHKMISHDGLHLTKAGARFYAGKIDIKEMAGV